ncbi:MAG: hypothetical protein OEN21_08435 [Myxococcales bacterium]|nr:hypothetical protein [Myxococcales bacterium]
MRCSVRYLCACALGLMVVGGCHVEALDFSSWQFFDQSQRIRTGDDLEDARAEMIELVFGAPMPTRLPDEVEATRDAAFAGHEIERIRVATDDLVSVAYLIHPGAWNGALAIYHHGHSGDFRELGRDTITAFLEEGFQVLAFSMPMRGLNTHPFATDEHSELQVRDRPLEYFADPVVVALNWADEAYSYRRRFMVGISGGGWTTVLVSGIDERIDTSYPVAGSWPHYLRDRFGFFGDYEERITPNYLELYLMATYPDRAQVQVFNEFDSCCFGGLYSYDYLGYTSYRANAWGGRFEIFMDHDQVVHEISGNVVREILKRERGDLVEPG